MMVTARVADSGLAPRRSPFQRAAGEENFGPKCSISSKFYLGRDPTSPRETQENIGPQHAERRRAPALALLVGLTSGLLLLLLRLLRPRARQPCCTCAFCTHNAPAAARADVAAAVADGRRASRDLVAARPARQRSLAPRSGALC